MYFSLLVSDNSLIIILFFYLEEKNQLRKFIHGAELSGFKKVVPRYKVQVNLKNGNFALCNLADVKSNFCAGQKGRARAAGLTRISIATCCNRKLAPRDSVNRCQTATRHQHFLSAMS